MSSLRNSLVCALGLLVVAGVALGDEQKTKAPRFAYAAPEEPGYSLTPRVEEDRILVKLTADAAKGAAALPQRQLPSGISGFDALLARHEIVIGRRVVQDHGRPVGDPRSFEKIGLDRLYELMLPDPLSESAVWKLVREFEAEPFIEYAEPVYLLVPTSTTPNDPEFGEQWSHVNTGQQVSGVTGTADADADTDLAWDTQTGSNTQIIAVLDSGADLDHPDLVDNLVSGWDFINDDPLPDDFDGHGTGASGIAAATGNNGIGVSGVCWSCGIMPLAVQNSVHETDAIRFAADNGARTYNMSHTFGTLWSQAIIDATVYASGLGSLGFASSTNFNGYNIGTPAVYPEVVSVGGSDQNDVRVYSYNDLSELTAPGPNTRSTALGGGYWYFGGTSSSSPFSAGLASLLLSQDPGLHVRELRHLLRVSCDDEVGAPAEDTPGWDKFMGYGRVNADTAMQMIGGPWIALDRPHYMCGGDLTVALKDTSAGSTVQVTLTGSVGNDVETLLLTPVAGANGYYEGTLPLSWAGQDGPVVVGDGFLDVLHGENVDATDGTLSTSGFLDCMKKVCQWEDLGLEISGDCDNDLALDPGELWTVSVPAVNIQTEELFDIRAELTTSNPDVVILKDTETLGDIPPFSGGHTVTDEAFRVQLAPGAAANQVADFTVTISGRGFEADQARCLAEEGFGDTFALRTNRDLGAQVQGWDFDGGNSMGFKVEASHGTSGPTGDLSECSGTWTNEWSLTPATDRSHSGAYAMRLGTGTDYPAAVDGALKTAPFTVPGGGGALSFFMWMDSFINDSARAWDGMVVEAKRLTDSSWTYVTDATYDSRQIQTACVTGSTKVPFGYVEQAPLFSGDGTGTAVTGDEFDVQHQADLSQFAGDDIQVRFRFGSHDFDDPTTHGEGTWVDTVALHDPWTADNWPGVGPLNLTGDDLACPTSFDLSWDAVPGAGSYEIHRSAVSCDDAMASLTAYDTSLTTGYSDAAATSGTTYYYAVGGADAVSGCPTVRACIEGGCAACALPPSPSGLLAERDLDDVLLTWSGSGAGGATYNVYRDPTKDPAGWGLPLDTGVTDQDTGTPGIQYRDVNGVTAGTIQYYLVTEVTCGESPLR